MWAKNADNVGGLLRFGSQHAGGVSLEFVAIDGISLEQTRCESIPYVGQQRCGEQPPWKLRFLFHFPLLALRSPPSPSPCPLDHLRESVTDGYRSGTLEEDPAIKDRTRCRSNRSARGWDSPRRLKSTRLSPYPTWTLRQKCMLLPGPPPTSLCQSEINELILFIRITFIFMCSNLLLWGFFVFFLHNMQLPPPIQSFGLPSLHRSPGMLLVTADSFPNENWVRK